MRLDKREFINMGALFSDSRLTVLVGCLELSLVHCRNSSSKLENNDEMEVLAFCRRKLRKG